MKSRENSSSRGYLELTLLLLGGFCIPEDDKARVAGVRYDEKHQVGGMDIAGVENGA